MVYRGCTVEIQPRNENNNLLIQYTTSQPQPCPRIAQQMYLGQVELQNYLALLSDGTINNIYLSIWKCQRVMRDQKCCFYDRFLGEFKVTWRHEDIIRARRISNASICYLSRAEAAQIWPEALQVELQILWEDVNLWRVSLCQLLSTPPGHSRDYGDHQAAVNRVLLFWLWIFVESAF